MKVTVEQGAVTVNQVRQILGTEHAMVLEIDCKEKWYEVTADAGGGEGELWIGLWRKGSDSDRTLVRLQSEHDDWVPMAEVSCYTAYVFLYREGGPGCGEMLFQREEER